MIYRTYVLPRLIDLAMRSQRLAPERARFVSLASGTVLEVGIGSGLNLPFYTADVNALVGLDPSRELWELGRGRVDRAPFPVEFVQSSGETIPYPDATFDTVVSTWTLCSIPDVAGALREMRRVLKPDGRLIFVEHGRSPDRRVVAWQDRLTPLWKRLGGGCHLNRPIDALIRDAGFRITTLEAGYGEGPRPFAFLFRGLAARDHDHA
jgi:ubiquinone/menaquinone biosynthesis C-methylase UbiE